VHGISDKMTLMFSTIMVYSMLIQVQLKPIHIEITSACISVKFWDLTSVGWGRRSVVNSQQIVTLHETSDLPPIAACSTLISLKYHYFSRNRTAKVH